MSRPRTITHEVKRFKERFLVLQRLFSETEECLAVVDYNNLLDREKNQGKLMDEALRASLKQQLDILPRFLVLGDSVQSKIAVINRLLSIAQGGHGDQLSMDDDHALFEGQQFLGYAPSLRLKYGDVSLYSLQHSCGGIVESYTGMELSRISLASGSESSSCSITSPTSKVRSESVHTSTDGKTLEYSLQHDLLRCGADILMPAYSLSNAVDVVTEAVTGVLPVVIYCFGSAISEIDMDFLYKLSVELPQMPIFFVRCQQFSSQQDQPEADQHDDRFPGGIQGFDDDSDSNSTVTSFGSAGSGLANRLANAMRPAPDARAAEMARSIAELGYISSNGGRKSKYLGSAKGPSGDGKRRLGQVSPKIRGVPPLTLRSDFIDRIDDFIRISSFFSYVAQVHWVHLSGRIHEVHSAMLNVFIMTAYDMQRDKMITPKKLEFAKSNEELLYSDLSKMLNEEQARIRDMISQVLASKRQDIIDGAKTIARDEQTSFDASSSLNLGASLDTWTAERPELTFSGRSERTLSKCVAPKNNIADAIQRYVLKQLSQYISDQLSTNLTCLRVTIIDTISRCLDGLEKMEVRGQKLPGEPDKRSPAQEAFSDILNACYKVEVTKAATRSLYQWIWDRMQQLFTNSNLHRVSSRASLTASFEQSCSEGEAVAEKVASGALSKICETKLSKSICNQLRERVHVAHERYCGALATLEGQHRDRLAKTDRHLKKLQKDDVPKLARLTLESLAVRDTLLHGNPQLGPEIGRGQYGVVYACERWGGHKPCAVKSVVPPDDKHFNDLSLEFFYTKSLDEHDRIVKLHGAVMDRTYGGGQGPPAVLLIMERLKRDLYCAIRAGLSWPARLIVAIDVVEGIRYLHARGLVHRDIKLKNVLLDEQNRGKITDLGFCKPEVMMSGSVVGTPIHMAPELFTGNYDNSVDVYAFGVLFWYICAGHTQLPQNFQACASKDQLWQYVRKGTRPEQLEHFDTECWDIMRSSWAGDPAKRPLLGDIQPRLEALLGQLQKLERHDQKTNSATSGSGQQRPRRHFV